MMGRVLCVCEVILGGGARFTLASLRNLIALVNQFSINFVSKEKRSHDNLDLQKRCALALATSIDLCGRENLQFSLRERFEPPAVKNVDFLHLLPLLCATK